MIMVMTMMITKCYSELKTLTTFFDRFKYLELGGKTFDETFGSYRYLKQKFYLSPAWLRARDIVIARDYGCDLGIEGRDIYDCAVVHHMNPIEVNDILKFNPEIINPEYLITTSDLTHKAIHYSDEKILVTENNIRRPGDTRLW